MNEAHVERSVGRHDVVVEVAVDGEGVMQGGTVVPQAPLPPAAAVV